MKRKGKSIVSIVAAITMLVSTFAAVVPETAEAASKGRVKSVKITNVKKKKLTLKKGKTFKLKVKVKVKPNKKKYKKVKFSSSNKKVATVSSKGKIKAKKKGKAKISVISKRNKKKKTVITVTVTDGKDDKKNLNTKKPSPSVRPSPTPTDNLNKKPSTASPSPSPSPTPVPTPTKKPDGSSTLSRKPFSGVAVVGKDLSKVTISGGSILDSNGNEIPGTYTWKNPEQTLEKAGKVYYEADFAPEDSSFEEVKGISVPVHVTKERLTLSAPSADSITTTQALSAARLYGGTAKDSNGVMVQGDFKWTDSTVVPGKPGSMPCSVTFVPNDKEKYQQAVCYVTVKVTGEPSGTAQEDKEIQLSSGNWKNDTAYDRAWSGNLYSLDSVISGIDMKLYDKITLTIKLYDTSNQPITSDSQGSAVCKLASSSSWTDGILSEIWTTEKASLSLEDYAGGTLNLVVQNTTEKIGYIEITSMTLNAKKSSNVLDGSSLKSAYGDMFGKVGVAIERFQLTSKNVVNFVKSQYNSLTMGNEMKPDYILGGNPSLSDTNPEGYVDTSTFKNKYKDTKYPKIDMAAIDSYIKTAYENGMKMRYHVFIWHAQSPQWFFKENYSTASSSKYVSADVMNGRLEYLIRNVMTHIYDLKDENGVYIGREVIDSWDVANEYFHNYDKGCKSYWDEVYYPEYEFVKNVHSGNNKPVYIKEAFALADSILKDYGMRDSVSLLFNEFNTYMEANKIVTMINYFNTKDEINPDAEIICDGIGMQTHLDIGYPTVEGIKENAIEKFRKAGFEIQITEADITAYGKADVSIEKQIQMWYDFMIMLMQEKEIGAKITGVTWWGPSDPTSWRAKGVPLLFSDYWQAKEHYFKVIQAVSDYNTGDIE